MSRVAKTAHNIDQKWRSNDIRQSFKADFSSLHLNHRVLAGLKKAGYKTPSPIQAIAIPPGIFGKDLLVQAKSGTGKTLVFVVVALQSLLEIKYPQVLIMVPTREIAVQVRDCVRAVGSGIKGLKCCSFIGGLPVAEDEENVVDCQIVVGTPGRLKQLISIGFIKTNSIRLMVLDEADNLIEQAFINDLNFIFQSLPKAKQVIATSATYPEELKNFIRHYFKANLFKARLNKKDFALLGMTHYSKVVSRSRLPLVQYKMKLGTLEKLLSSINFTQCLVFCNLKSIVESLCCDIRTWGFTTTFISANKEQQARLKAIENLKRFRCKVLVTSDVTARGIDAENVDLVINFDRPYKGETYFHRCGRAGRYGSRGVAVTLLTDDELNVFKASVESKKFKIYDLPDPIPKNLITFKPVNLTQSESSSDFEEQENSVDIISNGAVQHSSKENTVHTSEVEIIELDEEISITGSVELKEVKECNASKNILPKQDESEKCVSPTLNSVSSEQVNEDITAESPIASSRKSEVSETAVEESVVQNWMVKTLIETKASENSCRLIKECIIKDSEQQEKKTNLEDSHHDNLSGLNASDQMNTLNSLKQAKEKNKLNSDSEATFIEINEKLERCGCEKEIERIVDQVNSSCQTVTVSVQAESEKVAPLSELQKGIVKFLVDHEAEKDSKNLNMCKASPNNGTPNTVTEKFKDIRKDLNDFYHKIYKAYQVQSIDEASLLDFKISLPTQNGVEENGTSQINQDKTDTSLNEHNYAKTPKLELDSKSKKVTKQIIYKKIGVDSDSSDSSDSTSSESNLQSTPNVGDQAFANYILKGPLVSKSKLDECSDSDSEELLDVTVKKLSDGTSNTCSSSESEEKHCSSFSKLQSIKDSKKCPKSSYQPKNQKCDMSSKTLSKREVHTSKNRLTIKKKAYPKKNNCIKNEYSCKNKGSYLAKNISEESSDSDSEFSNEESTSSSLESKDNFRVNPRKLQSKVFEVPKKSPPNPYHIKRDMPSKTLIKQVNTSKNKQSVKKRSYSENNSAMKEYSCVPNRKNEQYHLENKTPSHRQMQNGTKSKIGKTHHKTAAHSSSDVSYQQGFNEGSYISKNQEQKKTFRNEAYENSGYCNYGGEGNFASHPYYHQHYDYFPTSATTNQVPVLQSGYSNHHCSCCVGNISPNHHNIPCNNMPGDFYNIFLKQCEFIQNFCNPNH